MACDCCCGGCQTIATDRSLPTAAIQPINQFCCKCVPISMCMTVGVDEYGDGGVSQFQNIYCVAPVEGENQILYRFSGFTINGSDATFNVRFNVDEYNECTICVDSPEIGSNDCIPVVNDHDGYPDDEFCCTFAAEWTVDTSYFGNSTDATTTVSIARYDAVDTRGIKCANCKCVCRCACITSIGTSGGFFGTACRLDEYGEVIWDAGTYAVTMKGKEDSYVTASTVTAGTETDSYADVNIKDGVVHQIDADMSGNIDVRYTIATDTTDDPIEMHWWGYVQGAAEIEFWEWNWISETWASIGTFSGHATSTLIRPKYRPMNLPTGGDLSQEVTIKITSSTADLVATDYLSIKSPDCCKLHLTDEYGDTPDGAETPVDISTENSCPDPVATWNLNDGDATVVSFSCLKCDDCGVVIVPCCDDPLPNVLVATITSDCYECNEMTFPITADGTSGPWTGEFSVGDCYATASFSCGSGEDGYPVWTMGNVAYGPCTQDPDPVEVPVTDTCDPLSVKFDVRVVGIACCPDTFDSTANITVCITE